MGSVGRLRSPATIVRRFGNVKALVAGDLMLDHFVWGSVERISPEAPVPVVQVTEDSLRLGGAANVVNCIRALGAEAMVCGVVGIDNAGRQLGEELRRVGAETGGLMRSRETATIRKTRIIAHQQQVVRLDREDRDQGTTRAAARARGFFLANLWKADVVVVSDYGKGLVTPPLLAALAAIRARRNFVLVVDPKQCNFQHYRHPTLITPNRDEASSASGIEIHDDASLIRAGCELLRRWVADAVLITRGEDGMSLFRPDQPVHHLPTQARHVFDVTGAGDTVVSACAVALGAGANLEAAAGLANHAAGVVVGEVGTATVSQERLRAALSDRTWQGGTR